MSRYKRAGIVLAITVFLVALVIIAIANRAANIEKIKEQNNTEVQVATEVQQENTASNNDGVSNEQTVDVNQSTDKVETPQVVEQDLQPKTDTDNTSAEVVNTFISFSEQDLLALVPGQDITEVMLVANKGVVLLTDNKKNERQIMYALDLFTTQGNTLHYYVSQSVYDSVEIGAKLNVVYSIYINDNKIEFPVIKNIAVVN